MKGFNKFTLYRQLDQMDCGPTCLKMIAKYYGKYYSLQTLRNLSYITRTGVNLNNISDAAMKIGFRTLSAKLSFHQLDEEATLPCILHWNQNHFVVLPPQNYNKNRKRQKILIADPSAGLIKVSKETFMNSWIPKGESHGIVLLLEPSPDFYSFDEEKRNEKGFSFLFRYLHPFKKTIWQLFLGMFISSVLSLIAPFLTQSMVDYGISQQNTSFINLILFSQLALFFGTTSIEAIRGWLLLHMNTRVNISIISDFLIKLMKLPIRYFDSTMVGDITQRINDHNRIESFLTGTSISTLFSLVNLIVFSVVLGIYSVPILLVFMFGSTMSILWIILFMKKRRALDYAKFQRMSENQNNLYEIITGMQEIKLNNSETTHLWAWERIQAKLFRFNIRGLALTQYQNIGTSFFTQLKNIFISFLSAQAVINGNISLGMLLSISYITGQMNAPISQLLTFAQGAQDAKISMERLNEIHSKDNEVTDSEIIPDNELELASSEFKRPASILIDNISFQYGGSESPIVLDSITLQIPLGKVTALVGSSGSGKTTLMKLLLKFYEPTKGSILLGSIPLNVVSHKWWRNQCGIVISDGFIFSNTIEHNISVQENTDRRKLLNAVKLANIDDFINSMPNGFSTKIGNAGNGISSGQQQRILIARALYKDPKFLFLDEATSKLDANNEKEIIANLSDYIMGRTVVVIAHRLSTVKNADQIVVMEKGRIVEIGTHQHLSSLKGKYYELVKNQLELGD